MGKCYFESYEVYRECQKYVPLQLVVAHRKALGAGIKPAPTLALIFKQPERNCENRYRVQKLGEYADIKNVSIPNPDVVFRGCPQHLKFPNTLVLQYAEKMAGNNLKICSPYSSSIMSG